MTLTARLATILGFSGPGQSAATGAAATPSASPAFSGAGAPARIRLAVVLTATAIVFLFATSANALATQGHAFATSFGAPGTEPGQFTSGPSGVAVGTSGEVFASDPGDSRIESFTATGTFKSEFPINAAEFTSPGAVAVDSAVAGGVYLSVTNATTGAPEVIKYSSTGTFQYALNPTGSETTINYGTVSVDPSSGRVYTLATNGSFLPVVDAFSQSTGTFVATFSGANGSPDGGFICPGAVAADDAGHVFVLDGCKNRVDRYSSTGVWEATIDDGSRGAPQAIATNPENGDLYVAEAAPSGLQVTYFSAAGAVAPQTFSPTSFGGLGGLAVGPDASAYLGDSANSVIDRFTTFEGPTVTTEAAAPSEATSATLNGSIDPGGVAATYHYEYGTEATYGTSTPEVSAGSGSGAVAAPAAITGLIPNTTYHYRLIGSNTAGSISGADATFTTAGAAPVVEGSPAFVTSITPTSATVHATVNPKNSLTTFVIEYGTSTAYGATAPEVPGEAGSANADTPVLAALSGLAPGTLYHYRVSADNGTGGPQSGGDATFITAPAAPATGTELTTKRAMLTGTINPHGAATTYRFNYGPSTSYGASTPETSGGSANGEQQVTEPISGLSPGTTYHVQVVATTNGVIRSGADGTFTTAPAPEATVTDPTSVTTGSATLNGAVNTNGLSGTYHFEVVSLDGSYTANTAEQSLAAATGARPVSTSDTTLPAAQSFRVRLIVSSNEATGFSGSVSFATPALPPEGFPAPPPPSAVYGCNAPHLNPYNAKAVPGSTISISGSDLGLAGTVLLGEESLNPGSWSAGGFTVQVPADAAGTLALRINCGKASNTIALATTKAPAGPSSAFTVAKGTVSGTTATLKLTLPGPGRLQASGTKIKGVSSSVAKAGTQMVKVTLTKAGSKALKKAKKHALTVKIQLRFTATGGTAASQAVSLTFKRKGGH